MDILTYPFDCYGEIPRPLILVKIKVGFSGMNSGIDSIVLGRDIICGKWRRLIINSESNNPKNWSVKIFI